MSIKPFPADSSCEQFLRTGGQPTPDSDISGVGVIIAFTLSAYLTFALVFGCYLFGGVDGSLLNRVDTHVFRIRPYRPRSRRFLGRVRFNLALEKAIIALSDQQIVTGIAIMAAGFQGLRLGGIDSYHYQTVLYLAWMSSSVHLSALSILAPVLRGRPALRIWRLVGMLVLLVLLLVGLVPTVSNDWGLLTWDGMNAGQSGWGIPAICFWGKTYGDGVNPDAVLGFLILVISYIWKVGGISSKACAAFRRLIRHPVQYAFERLLTFTAKRCSPTPTNNRTKSLAWLIAHHLILAVWIPYFAVFETLASFSSAIWISALGLVFGTIQIAMPRQQNENLLGPNENVWGFGQLVPLILLVQPLSTVWEVLVVDASLIQEEQLYHTPEETQSATPKPLPSSLLVHLTTSTPPPPSSRPYINPTPTIPELLLLTSPLFSLNVYLIQPALIAAATIAYWNDAELIGYSTTGNWSNFCVVLGAYVGVAWIVTFVAAPWSRVGKWPGEWRGSGNEGGGGVEEGKRVDRRKGGGGKGGGEETVVVG